MHRTSIFRPLLKMVGVGAIAGLAVSASLAAPAFASGPNEGTQNPGVATCAESCAAGKPFSSGQIIDVTIPANSNLTPGEAIQILECSDPGGTVANDPTSVNNCDTNTLYQETYFVQSDGSVHVTDYEVYALPDPNIESAPSITCNDSDPCVLYVGLNDQSFSGAPYFLSQPFTVTPNGSDSGVNPGDGTPEVPLAIGLPLLAIGLLGGTLFLKRRRSAAAQH